MNLNYKLEVHLQGETAEELVQKSINNRNTDKKFENLLKKISKSIK